MNPLDNYQRQIIHYLGHRGASNTNQIAEGLKISWATANKKLIILYQVGYVVKKGTLWDLKYKPKK